MSTENLSPQIIRQVMKELQDLTTSPPEGIKVGFLTRCLFTISSKSERWQHCHQSLLIALLKYLLSSLLILLLPLTFLSKVATNEEDITEVHASIDGPIGTPYADGLFRMKLVLGKDYPQAPPKGFFLTKIFHPNVSSTGEICVNVLKKDWKPDLGIVENGGIRPDLNLYFILIEVL